MRYTLLLTALILTSISVKGQTLVGPTTGTLSFSTSYIGTNVMKHDKNYFTMNDKQYNELASYKDGKWNIKDTIGTLNELMRSYKVLDSLMQKQSDENFKQQQLLYRQINIFKKGWGDLIEDNKRTINILKNKYK